MFFLRKTIVLVLILALPAFLFAFGTQESGEQAGEQAEQPAEQPADQEAAQQPADQATQPAEQAQPPAEQQMAAATNLRLEDAIGMTAASEDGSVQGQIQDFVFSSAGDISHVVISFQPAGAAAGAEAQPAQPADQAAQPADQQAVAAGAQLVTADRVTFEADRAVVQVTQDEIQSLPSMQDGALPQDVAQGSILGSQLSNWSVVGQQGEEIGQVQGAMLNLAEKRWEYLAVAPAGVLGLAEQYYAVPADAISEINPDQSQITLSIAADQFGQYTGFGQDNWPQEAGAAGETQAAPTEQAPADQSAPANPQQ
jgi:sporulation protein YlmC with PRC-barrel domain